MVLRSPIHRQSEPAGLASHGQEDQGPECQKRSQEKIPIQVQVFPRERR